VKPHLPAANVRTFTGIKYHAITGGSGDKLVYNRRQALETAADHAQHFLEARISQISRLAHIMDRPPLILSPYDAELFGHWWYEGPEFLDYFVRKAYYDQQVFKLATPHEYLQQHPTQQVAQPSASSWGEEGYWKVWLNETNEWILPHLDIAQMRMTALVKKFPNASGLTARALKQAGRETPPRAIQRLALHSSHRHQPRLRAAPGERPFAPLHRAARTTHGHANR
jgi:1,4-alpha-glucan branching enzyme